MLTEYHYSTSVRVFVSVFLTVVASFGIFGNALVCVVFVVKRNLRSSINMVVFSLAIADILQSCNMILMIISVNYGKWILGHTMCQINGFITIAFVVTSLLHLFLISVNRYVMVCIPGKKHLLSKKLALGCIIVSWVYPAILGICPLLGWSKYTYRPGKLMCTIRFNTSVSYTIILIGSALLIPFTGICFFYYKIMRKIIRNRKIVGNISNSIADQRKKEEVRIAVMLGVVILSFMVFYAPAGGANIAEITVSTEYELPIALDLFSVLLAMLNHANNPIIYGFMNQKFKEALWARFKVRSNDKSRVSSVVAKKKTTTILVTDTTTDSRKISDQMKPRDPTVMGYMMAKNPLIVPDICNTLGK